MSQPTEPYRESEDHTPDPTAVTAQLDTTGLGGPSQVDEVTPIFQQAAQQAVVDADAAAQEGDTSQVVLPDDPDQHETALAELHDKATKLRDEEGVVPAAEQQEEALRRGAAPAGGDPRPADEDDEAKAKAEAAKAKADAEAAAEAKTPRKATADKPTRGAGSGR